MQNFTYHSINSFRSNMIEEKACATFFDAISYLPKTECEQELAYFPLVQFSILDYKIRVRCN